MEPGDQDISELKKRIIFLEEQNEILRFENEILKELNRTLGPAYAELSKEYAGLAEGASQCVKEVSHHYIAAVKQGEIYNPEFVRLRISDLTDSISLNTNAMKATVDTATAKINATKARLHEKVQSQLKLGKE